MQEASMPELVLMSSLPCQQWGVPGGLDPRTNMELGSVKCTSARYGQRMTMACRHSSLDVGRPLLGSFGSPPSQPLSAIIPPSL